MWTKVCWFAEVVLWAVIGIFTVNLIAVILEAV